MIKDAGKFESGSWEGDEQNERENFCLLLCSQCLWAIT